jgi:hypothetical protein
MTTVVQRCVILISRYHRLRNGLGMHLCMATRSHHRGLNMNSSIRNTPLIKDVPQAGRQPKSAGQSIYCTPSERACFGVDSCCLPSGPTLKCGRNNNKQKRISNVLPSLHALTYNLRYLARYFLEGKNTPIVLCCTSGTDDQWTVYGARYLQHHTITAAMVPNIPIANPRTTNNQSMKRSTRLSLGPNS